MTDKNVTIRTKDTKSDICPTQSGGEGANLERRYIQDQIQQRESENSTKELLQQKRRQVEESIRAWQNSADKTRTSEQEEQLKGVITNWLDEEKQHAEGYCWRNQKLIS